MKHLIFTGGSMIRNYFIVALRNYLKYRLHSLVNILGLSGGIAISILILILVRNELSYDRYNTNWQQIYRVNSRASIDGNVFHQAITPVPLAGAIKKQVPGTMQVTRLLLGSHKKVSYKDVHYSADRFYYADNSFFSIFSIPIIRGDKINPLIKPFSIVITEETAQKYFGSADPVGKVLDLDNGWSFTITAVCSNVPDNSHFHFDYLASLSDIYTGLDNAEWSMEVVATYVLFGKEAGIDSVQLALDEIVRVHMIPILDKLMEGRLQEFEKGEDYYQFYLQPLTDIHFDTTTGDEFEAGIHKQYIYIFSVIAVLILIIACVNFMNLSTAKSAGRAREVALRKVAGASKKQMIIQFLSESVFMSFLALFLSMVILELLLRPFNRYSGMNLDIFYFNTWYLIPSFFIGALLIGIFAGSYPAFYLSSFNTVSVLRGRNSKGMKSTTLRGLLVLGQFSVSIALAIASMIMYGQVRFFRETNLGFNKNDVVVIQRAYALKDKTDAFKAELLEYPGIMNASVSLAMPGRTMDYFPVRTDTTGRKEILYLVPIFADRNFLETMQLYLVEGKNFSDDSSCLNSIIINEAAVKRLGMTDPLGKIVRGFSISGEEKNYTITGVVRDYHFESLRKQVEPLAMAILEKGTHVQYLAVRLDGSDRNGATKHIENTWEKFVRDEPFDYYFLDEDLNMQYKEEESTANIFSIFTFLAILIAALGLFGLASHTAEQRTREIGIRKAMGASTNRITLMLALQFTRWVFWSCLIAIPVAWIGMRLWLSRFAYHIAIDGWLFLLAAASAFIIAVVTVSYQAVRSANENPVHALQYE